MIMSVVFYFVGCIFIVLAVREWSNFGEPLLQLIYWLAVALCILALVLI